MHAKRTLLVTTGRLAAMGVVAAFMSLGTAGCDNTTSKSKSTSTKTEQTPEGKKTTTETHEKKVETEKKP